VGVGVVHQHSALKPVALEQAEFQLVGHHGCFEAVLQELDLGGGHIGHTQRPHLAFRHQLPDGGCHLRRFHQGIRPVQQEDVHVVGTEPLEAAVHPLNNGVRAQVVVDFQPAFVQPDAALGLQLDALPQPAGTGKHFPEDSFGFSVPVDVSMVEQGHPDVQRGLDCRCGGLDVGDFMRLGGPVAAQAHASVKQPAVGCCSLFSHGITLSLVAGRAQRPAAR
jgi:hypothetical protein